jgi:hypothetical protein
MSLVKPFVSVPYEARRQEISVNGFKFETFGKNGFIEAPVPNRVCNKECVIEENEVDTGSRLQKVSVKVVFIAFLCIIKHKNIVILLEAGLKKTQLCSIFSLRASNRTGDAGFPLINSGINLYHVCAL